MICPSKTRVLLCGLMALALVMGLGFGTGAKAQTQTNIPVLVVGEDQDPRSVKRSSAIFKRVLSAVKAELFARGFQVMDEDFLAAETGWQMTDRRDKVELVRAAKAANASGLGAMQSRALVLIRVHAASKDQGFATEVMARVDGELYDLESNQFLGAFDGPRDRFAAPAGCTAPCLAELVGDKARDLAGPVGMQLAEKLQALSVDRVRGTGGELSPNQGDPRCQALASSYTLELRDFDLVESREILETMTQEFPCVVSHDRLPDGPDGMARYGYSSTATRAKLDSWLTILLLDMGLEPGRDVDIAFGASTVLLTRR